MRAAIKVIFVPMFEAMLQGKNMKSIDFGSTKPAVMKTAGKEKFKTYTFYLTNPG